eukprot:m.31328 g.31328  ORF g.31328 m.31328 type:complete len:67 (+) comp9694_c0_seq1:388-588(+)
MSKKSEQHRSTKGTFSEVRHKHNAMDQFNKHKKVNERKRKCKEKGKKKTKKKLQQIQSKGIGSVCE